MLGLPDKKHHLEFTQYQTKTALQAPTKENLMVFYFDSEEVYHSTKTTGYNKWEFHPWNRRIRIGETKVKLMKIQTDGV